MRQPREFPSRCVVLYAVLAVLMVAGGIFVSRDAHAPHYYRKTVVSGQGVVTYWREAHPTTKHGICAALSAGGSIWEVDHPTGVNPETHMSTDTETRIYTSKDDAIAWAESVCPSKVRP